VRAIREWLESGQDYAQGVALYEKHGRSAVVRKVLAFGETEFTRGKLLQELTKMAGISPNDGNLLISAPVRVVDPSPKRVDETPKREHVDPQRRDWFAERNYLHAQLGLVATDAERRVMALRILELAELISQSYAADKAADKVDKPDTQPGHPWDTLTDEGEIRRLLANLRPQRSKLKKRPDRAADLAQVAADIHLLEAKLKT
jgi:hypothetical protein